jgi:hypothetical protein
LSELESNIAAWIIFVIGSRQTLNARDSTKLHMFLKQCIRKWVNWRQWKPIKQIIPTNG